MNAIQMNNSGQNSDNCIQDNFSKSYSMNPNKKANILLVEDELSIALVVKEFLEHCNFNVKYVQDSQKALKEFVEAIPPIDVCILDINMPQLNGWNLAERIKKHSPTIALIFLTANHTKEDKLKGFDLGADDFITKPFSMEELVARIESILRRYQHSIKITEQRPNMNIGFYEFDPMNQKLMNQSKVQCLTKKESEVLWHFANNQNVVINRSDLLNAIWKNEAYTRSLDVYVTKLRNYLREDSRISIHNIHGTGFKFEVMC